MCSCLTAGQVYPKPGWKWSWMWVLFWGCHQIWMPAHLALLQTDNSFWDEVTVEYKSYFLDKIRVLFAPGQRFSKGWKRNVSLSPSVSLLKLVPSCYAATTVWEVRAKAFWRSNVVCGHTCTCVCKCVKCLVWSVDRRMLFSLCLVVSSGPWQSFSEEQLILFY